MCSVKPAERKRNSSPRASCHENSSVALGIESRFEPSSDSGS